MSRDPGAVYIVVVTPGCNHALHLVLTVLTCGAWFPIWLLVAICCPRRVEVVEVIDGNRPPERRQSKTTRGGEIWR